MRIMTWLAAALFAVSPAMAQQRIDRPGPVAHEAARTAFPERVGGLRRANVVSYGPNGDDVSASYNLVRDGRRLLITVYIYPASRIAGGARAGDSGTARSASCQAEFDGVNGAIEQAHPTARRLESGPASALVGVPPELSHRSVYTLRTEFGDRIQAVRSEARLYCYVGGDWLVKYRISSSEGMEVAADIEAFIANGPWPGRLPADPDTVAP